MNPKSIRVRLLFLFALLALGLVWHLGTGVKDDMLSLREGS